jgi:hypothetical protein
LDRAHIEGLPPEVRANIERMKIGKIGHARDGMIIGQSPNTGPEAVRHHVTEGCFIQDAGVLAGLAGEARRGDVKFTFALHADIGSFREAEDVLGIDRLWFLACQVLGLRTAWKHQRHRHEEGAARGQGRKHEVFLKSLDGSSDAPE